MSNQWESEELPAGGPPLPVLGTPWRMRALSDSSADSEMVAGWMARPHISHAWNQDWGITVWRKELAAQIAGGRSLPSLLYYEDREFAYVEIYWAYHDRLSAYYAVSSHDLGIHVAIGNVGDTGRGLGTQMFEVLARGLLIAEPECSRVVAEPDSKNPRTVRALLKAGFEVFGSAELPEKNAVLVRYERSSNSI